MRSASLTIRKIPGKVLQQLKERAARHRRSMQGEILSILESATVDASARLDAEGLFRRVQSLGLHTPAEGAEMIRQDRDGHQRR
jgi:plasmid stability protein